MMDDLKRLRELATAANRPDPWLFDEKAFRNKATPAVILSLVERVEKAEAQLDEVAKAIGLPAESWRIATCQVLAHYAAAMHRNLQTITAEWMALKEKV